MTITEFLLARIAEDEEVAKDAALGAGGIGFGKERIANGKSWSYRYHEVVRPIVPGVTDRRTLADCGGFGGLPIAPHIARHDPARVLAECEAKRRIVEEHTIEGSADDSRCRHIVDEPCPTLRALASIYADHEDFDPAWRVA